MQLNTDVRFLVVAFLSLLISIVVHEFAHAWVAHRLGDDTARRQGFMTLNPMAQIQRHPVGAFALPLLGPLFGMLIGWGSVPVDPAQADRKYSIRQAEFLIAIAGPAANVLLAGVALGAYAIFIRTFDGDSSLASPLIHMAVMLVRVNLFLAVFNMLPMAPLDGFTVLNAKAPESWRPAVHFIAENSNMIFIAVLMLGRYIFAPVAQLAWFLLTAVR